METLSPETRTAKLNELYEFGKAKGTLTYKEIMDRLMEMEMDPDQLDKVLETLDAYGVSVVNETDLTDEARAEAEAAQGKEPLLEDLDL